MSITTDLTAIKTLLTGITGNKVSRIAYDQTAYAENDVTSPAGYAWAQHNNIPSSSMSATKLTETQVDKGFRLKLPILNKYFFNHFFGRSSYNLNKLSDMLYSLTDSLISFLGQANGLATLDSNGRLPASQATETLMSYQGAWNAETNTPTLVDGTGTKGDVYLCNVAGTVNFGHGNISFKVNDRCVYDGSVWVNFSSGNVRRVASVYPDGVTGNVDLSNQAQLSKIFSTTHILGKANGLATLDANVQLPEGQVTTDTMLFKGDWNADTNTPTLSDSTGTEGYYYFCNVGGTVTFGTDHTETFSAGDRLIYRNGRWVRFSAGAVQRVSEISPDVLGNVDLSTQADVTKILNPNVLGTLFYWGIGRNWAQGSGTTGFTDFLCVWHANNMWVAGAHSNGGLWWSEDGKNWTQSDTATISTSHIRSVYFGNNVWVACTESNGIWWSEDGKNWTQSSTTATQSLSFRKVLYNTNMWVAVANGSVWYSTDGKTWTQASGITSSDYYAVVKSNSLWVVGSGSTAGAYWSTDGISWTACTGGITGVYKLYYKNNMFIACTSSGLWWSTDGKAWTQTSTMAIQSYVFYSVYYANGVWIAGTNGQGVWYSTDGKTWTQGSGIGTADIVPFVFYANSIYLAGSYTTGLWISNDGKSWSLISSEIKFTSAVPFDYGIFQEGMFLLASTAGLYYSDWTTI